MIIIRLPSLALEMLKIFPLIKLSQHQVYIGEGCNLIILNPITQNNFSVPFTQF